MLPLSPGETNRSCRLWRTSRRALRLGCCDWTSSVDAVDTAKGWRQECEPPRTLFRAQHPLLHPHRRPTHHSQLTFRVSADASIDPTEASRRRSCARAQESQRIWRLRESELETSCMKWSAKHKLHTARGKLNSRRLRLPTQRHLFAVGRETVLASTGIIDQQAGYMYG